MKKITLLTAMILVCAGTLTAQDEEKTKPKHKEDHYHISTFAGFTTNYKGKEGYKLGIEYEWRIEDWIGLGGTFDFTGNDFNIFAFSVGTSFYPFKFPLIPAVGVGLKNYNKSKWKPFFRTVLLYDFHIGNFSIGPMVMYDLFPEEKDIMSYGVTIGYSLH